MCDWQQKYLHYSYILTTFLPALFESAQSASQIYPPLEGPALLGGGVLASE
jgi:hypothetical protein